MSETATGADAVGMVRWFWPAASDDEVHDLLWGRTGWPCFWGPEGMMASIYGAMSTLRETLNAGLEPCTWCNKPGPGNGRDCARCDRALRGDPTP